MEVSIFEPDLGSFFDLDIVVSTKNQITAPNPRSDFIGGNISNNVSVNKVESFGLKDMPTEIINLISDYLKREDIISLYQISVSFRNMIGRDEMLVKINNTYDVVSDFWNSGNKKKYTLCHECRNMISPKNVLSHKSECKGGLQTCYRLHSNQIAEFRVSDKTKPVSALSCYITSSECKEPHTCPFKFVTCEFCSLIYRKYLDRNHSSCGSVIVPCPHGCDFKDTKRLMSNHKNFCIERLLMCEKCNGTYKMKDEY
jgi:hypothetical protein